MSPGDGGAGRTRFLFHSRAAYMAHAEPVHSLATRRLVLRQARADDAPFILELLNDPLWLRFIGDRGIRSLEAAGDYIANVVVAMYARSGVGLYVAEERASGQATGLCGLLSRPTLPDLDLGFAFLPRYRRSGYGDEASRAWLAHAATSLGLRRVVAITDPDNDASAALLRKLGMRFERMVRLAPDDTDLCLFAVDPATVTASSGGLSDASPQSHTAPAPNKS